MGALNSDDLAQAVDAFLAGGGRIVELNGFDPKPLPPRRAEPAKPSPKHRRICKKSVRDEKAKLVAKYAHLGVVDCAAVVGISKNVCRSIASEYGIKMRGRV